MRIFKIFLIAFSGCVILAAALWLLAGYGVDTPTPDHQQKVAVAQPASPEPARRVKRQPCDPEQTFHLDRLQANQSLKVVELGKQGISNIQKFLDLTMQTPLKLNEIPRMKVWVAWQYAVQSLGGSAPAQGVIDVVQDDCVLYRREGEAAEIVAIANGNWSQ